MSVKILMTRADGRKTLVIGLAQENMDKLSENMPYLARAEATGIGIDVVIIFRPKIENVISYLREQGVDMPEGAEQMAALTHADKGGTA